MDTSKGHGTHIAAIILHLTKNVDLYIGKVTDSSKVSKRKEVTNVNLPISNVMICLIQFRLSTTQEQSGKLTHYLFPSASVTSGHRTGWMRRSVNAFTPASWCSARHLTTVEKAHARTRLNFRESSAATLQTVKGKGPTSTRQLRPRLISASWEKRSDPSGPVKQPKFPNG